MKFWFYNTQGKVTGREFTTEFIRIGRDPKWDFSIANDTVSADHASVSRINGKYIISDLNSTNGTWVNGSQVQKKTLTNGDILQFGGFECWFEETEIKPATNSEHGTESEGQEDTTAPRQSPEPSPFSLQRTLRALEKSVCLCFSDAMVKTFPCNAKGDLPVSIQNKDKIFKYIKSGEAFFEVIPVSNPKGRNDMLPFSEPGPLVLLKDKKHLSQIRKYAARVKLAYPVGRNNSHPRAVLYVELFKPDTLAPGFMKNVEAAINWAINLMDNPSK